MDTYVICVAPPHLCIRYVLNTDIHTRLTIVLARLADCLTLFDTPDLIIIDQTRHNFTVVFRPSYYSVGRP
jgi:hypothetical protein